MSQEEQVTIKCPFCGAENDFTIWHSINTELNPEMKDAFKYGKAFQLHCHNCGKDTIVFYSCLYHQMRNKIMIYLVGEDSVEDACNIFDSSQTDGNPMMSALRKEHYLYRVVTSINDLMEKIRIFDAGKDDRVIEIYKKLLKESIAECNADISFDKILYDDEKGDSFLLFDQGGCLGSAPMKEEVYKDIEGSMSSHCDMRDEESFVIDSKWADAAFGVAADVSFRCRR